MICRLGSPESAPSGVALEFYGGRKIVLRGWHPPGVNFIPPVHIDIEEFCRTLGLQLPPKRGRKPPVSNVATRRKGEELPA